MSSSKTYRLVGKVLNNRLNQIRESAVYTVPDRQTRAAEIMGLMDRFSEYFQTDNEHFNRQVFEKEVTKFPEQ